MIGTLRLLDAGIPLKTPLALTGRIGGRRKREELKVELRGVKLLLFFCRFWVPADNESHLHFAHSVHIPYALVYNVLSQAQYRLVCRRRSCCYSQCFRTASTARVQSGHSSIAR